jgi:hypothetical protein
MNADRSSGASNRALESLAERLRGSVILVEAHTDMAENTSALLNYLGLDVQHERDLPSTEVCDGIADNVVVIAATNNASNALFFLSRGHLRSHYLTVGGAPHFLAAPNTTSGPPLEVIATDIDIKSAIDEASPNWWGEGKWKEPVNGIIARADLFTDEQLVFAARYFDFVFSAMKNKPVYLEGEFLEWIETEYSRYGGAGVPLDKASWSELIQKMVHLDVRPGTASWKLLK